MYMYLSNIIKKVYILLFQRTVFSNILGQGEFGNKGAEGEGVAIGKRK